MDFLGRSFAGKKVGGYAPRAPEGHLSYEEKTKKEKKVVVRNISQRIICSTYSCKNHLQKLDRGLRPQRTFSLYKGKERGGIF
jgi:hypothetical protein